MKKQTVRLALLAIIVVAGLFLRIWGIRAGSFAFTYDVGRDLLVVRNFVAGGKISLIGPTSGQMGIFYGPWWYWFLAVPFVLFGGNPGGIATSIALVGIAAVVVAYWWGNRRYDGYFSVAFAGILAVAPSIVAATSQIWSPDLLIPATLIIVALWSGIKKLSFVGLVTLGLLLGLLGEMEIVYGAIFLFGFFGALFFWQRSVLFSKKMIPLAAGIIGVALPRFLFELRHDFLQTHAFITMARSGIGFSFHPERIWIIVDSIRSVLPGDGLEVHLILFDFILVLFVLQWKHLAEEVRLFIRQLVTLIGVFVFFTFFLPKDFWSYYLLGLPVIYAFFVALAFPMLSRYVPKRVTILAIVLFLVILAKPLNAVSAIRNTAFVGDAAVYRNQLEVVNYLYSKAEKKNFNVIVYTPPQIDYTWRYLLWWTARRLGWGVTDATQDTLFVIIEPDPGYPLRLSHWLEQRQHDGTVVDKQLFSSGIIVETRKRTH